MGVGTAQRVAAEPAASVDVVVVSPRRRILRAAPLVWLVALVLYSALWSFPLSHGQVIPWVLLLLVACCVATPGRRLSQLAIDWLPFVAILFAYGIARGVADGLMTPHYLPQIDADQFLFGGVAPTVWLQQHLYHGGADLRWYDWAAFGVYLTHFFATLAVAVGLWLAAPHRFKRWVAMVSLLAGMGFVTYALFPAAPPWLAGQTGHMPPVHRIMETVFAHVPHLNSVFASGTGIANQVAAVPSLHSAYALLVALFLIPLVGWRWRWLVACYPVAMGLSLVYSGEHFAIDVLLGWGYAVLAFVAVDRFADRRAARRPGAGATPRPAPAAS